MEFHEFAACYPLLEGEPLETLADDIRKHGLMEPIVLFQGKVLDGRNRTTCCTIAGVEPRFREFEGTEEEALHYVCSVNTHRRHLTKSQLAMAAAKAREHFDKMAKKRMEEAADRGREKQKGRAVAKIPQPTESRARDEAGKAFGVSGRMVDYATNVIEKGTPKLNKAVEEGRLNVQKAARIAKEPKRSQNASIKKETEAHKPKGESMPPKMQKSTGAPKATGATNKRLAKLIELVEGMKRNADKPQLQVSLLDIRTGLNEVLAILNSMKKD